MLLFKKKTLEEEKKDQQRRPTELKTYPQAWIALAILLLLRIATSVFQFTYSVIPNVAAQAFQVSLTAITWLANLQGLVYVFMSFFTGWIYEKLGVKRSLILSGFFCIIGSGIRMAAIYLDPPSFALTMVGQIIGSIAAPLALNIMSLFASTWFTENLRATAGMFVASNYGAILVMFMVPNVTKTIHEIPLTLSIVGGIALGAFILLLFMPAQPPQPPSHVSHQPRPSFRQGLSLLAKNASFWIIFLIQGINVGISIAFGTIFTQIIAPYGYTDAQAGQINAIGFFAGTIGCAVSGFVLDATKQHRFLLKAAPPLVFFSNLGFYLLIPVAMETGCETAYPVSEATASSFLWQGAQIFGFIFMAVMDGLRDPTGDPENNMQRALLLLTILTGLMSILAFLFNGAMARSEAIARVDELDPVEETA
ncbi:major facilitator superfamily domain-containing protein [Chlamydoabsidia padenii]|nr:major facilitator superfamily domain-containing protein [Chlamydoabsidia padenii]